MKLARLIKASFGKNEALIMAMLADPETPSWFANRTFKRSQNVSFSKDIPVSAVQTGKVSQKELQQYLLPFNSRHWPILSSTFNDEGVASLMKAVLSHTHDEEIISEALISEFCLGTSGLTSELRKAAVNNPAYSKGSALHLLENLKTRLRFHLLSDHEAESFIILLSHPQLTKQEVNHFGEFLMLNAKNASISDDVLPVLGRNRKLSPETIIHILWQKSWWNRLSQTTPSKHRRWYYALYRRYAKASGMDVAGIPKDLLKKVVELQAGNTHASFMESVKERQNRNV